MDRGKGFALSIMKHLAEIQTKKAFANKVSSITENQTKGFFKDCDWSNVRKVIAQITNNGGEVELIKSEYFGDNAGKRFYYNISNAFVSVQFILVATFTGREDEYDISFYSI